VQCSAVQCSAVQCTMVERYTAYDAKVHPALTSSGNQYYADQQCVVNCTTLHYTTLHYIKL
jgi:hypothetical protein